MAHFDPSDDFSRLLDRLEPIRLIRRGGPIGGQPLTALRQAVSHDDNEAELVWLLPVGEISEAPRSGEVILDAAAVRHAILDAQSEAAGTRWRCRTRRAAESEASEPVELLEAIHARWAASASLCALLPETRLFSDLPADGMIPSAQLTLETCKPLMRHGDGTRVDEALVRIAVCGTSSSATVALRGEVIFAMDRAAMPLSGGGRVLQMRLAAETRQRQRDDVFLATLDFQCLVLVPRT